MAQNIQKQRSDKEASYDLLVKEHKTAELQQEGIRKLKIDTPNRLPVVIYIILSSILYYTRKNIPQTVFPLSSPDVNSLWLGI